MGTHDPRRLVVLHTTAAVAGGAALAREDSGRVVFVDGALPGETVRVEITGAKRDFARARLVDVVEPAPDRVEPPCPFVARGCGGCDQQHVHPDAQPALKRAIVTDALRRIGRIADPMVALGPPLADTAYRTSIRALVVGGRAAFRRARTHAAVAVDHCLVAHPYVEAVRTGGHFGDAREVTIRAGVASGEVLVIVDPDDRDIEVPTALPAGVSVAHCSTARAERRDAPALHEEVLGTTFRVSAGSFFQSRPDGAADLVRAVRSAGGDDLARATRVVDAYAGVGLFSALATPERAHVVAVEANPSSARDARANVARDRVDVITSMVEDWSPSPADVVIADPARTGLRRDAVDRLVATQAAVIVLVSCDAAALGRDVALLDAEGYRFEGAELVDMFPHTHHVEVVSRLRRA